ncbi:hypothetical protein L6452_12750 [Arctium lappa]|uniref:Uncharacterized protein n=1 Tax=Arctium lappa TaxID=4217 RepID=A0ACB9CGL8_ARCLA|nr:hypothetical protein L6452_12750 [Arctium lappa]
MKNKGTTFAIHSIYFLCFNSRGGIYMTGPNMAAITASLERSLQSFSLNHHHQQQSRSSEGGLGFERSSESPCHHHHHHHHHSPDATLELNSNITLPYHWEQCLDLKTGEVYYINWRTGMKSKEDPRTTVDDGFSGYFYSDDEEDEEDEDEDEDEEEEYESEGSSVESSAAAAAAAASSSSSSSRKLEKEIKDEGRHDHDHVLVVAGCKGCFMYFMVPKQVEDCPKCCGQLLHFDRSDDN